MWAANLACVPLFAALDRERVLAIARLADVERCLAGLGDRARGRSRELVLPACSRAPRSSSSRVAGDPLARGDYFGELALLDESPRTGTVVTTDETVVARIGRSSFLRLVEAEPKVAARAAAVAGRPAARERVRRHP